MLTAALEGKMEIREQLKNKKRVVIKIGSSSLTHVMTGEVDYQKMEQLTRALCDLRGMGKDVILVSSGAIAVGNGDAYENSSNYNIGKTGTCSHWSSTSYDDVPAIICRIQSSCSANLNDEKYSKK